MNLAQQAIRIYMATNGINQTDLAGELNVLPGTVSNWCAGKTAVPSAVLISLLADKTVRMLFNSLLEDTYDTTTRR